MAVKNILVPFDDSDHAYHALRKAIELTDGNPEAQIHVVEVAPPEQDLVYSSINPNSFGSNASIVSKEVFAEAVAKRTKEAADDLKVRIATEIDSFPGTITAEVAYGIYTVETILDEAKSYGVEMIVMGSRGLGAIRGMIGSVSYGVLRSSDLPVLIVK